MLDKAQTGTSVSYPAFLGYGYKKAGFGFHSQRNSRIQQEKGEEDGTKE